MLDRSRSRDRSKTGGAFSPAGLFVTGAQGAWYDPSDYSTLFQNSTGTTPVTAVEQPVRLMLDRSGRGNHATAPNDASRPVLRSRYNQITFSEQFDNAAWGKEGGTTITANAAVAPDGTTTADTLSGADGTTFTGNVLRRSVTPPGTNWHGSIYIKSLGVATTATLYFRDGTAGTVSSQSVSLSTDWVRLGRSFTQTNSGFIFIGNTDGDVAIWGAQVLSAADQTATGGAYQRVAAATDYDTSNPVWRPYLAFDGSDDSLSTSAIDFSGTDEMTVFAGLKQQSPNTNSGQIIELSADVGLNNGAFGLAWPANTDINTLRFQVRGTTFVGVNDAAATTQTNTVISLQADISAPSIVGRRNGTQVASSSSSLGTGNFGNYPLFIGRRNNTSNPFNGRLYSLAVLGRTATVPELTAMETWIAGKTGVSI